MANGVDAVVKLAEKLKAPVCNTYLHNDSFPQSHELWMGPLGYQVWIVFIYYCCISAYYAYYIFLLK